MNQKLVLLLFLAFGLLTTGRGSTTPSVRPIVVSVDQPIAPIQSTMWGIFFEDINFAADGGLYAELVKNRSFEFAKPLMGWKILKKDASEGVLVINAGETNRANPRFVRISKTNAGEKFGLENEGFRGMGIKRGMTYHFSMMARNLSGHPFNLKVELVSPSGAILGRSLLPIEAGDWQRASVAITATTGEQKAKLNLWFESEGTLDVDMVSLFPEDTWKKRPGGLRADLVQLLADLKPGFLRFPGGCIVEGYELATRYQWKKTIGKIEERTTGINRWNTEFKHRLTPDYYQSFGLGFFEYFQLAEDIGAQPLPILSCGMACQYNSGEVVPMDQLEPYLQDALDLIEFANGPSDSEWGRIRTEMGHPAPFHLKMIGIGNEQWGAQYIERYEAFVKKLKGKYPEITLVSGTGPSPDGKFFDLAARELTRLKAEIVDEHYYANPDWFLKNATRYDHYDRKGYKIFAGEYAAQSISGANPDNKNNWRCALSEAAFMTGLERNAEVVSLCSYAPLFAHVDAWQWTPDLIWFDNLTSYGTPNYYVQKLFSNNKGTEVLPMLANHQPLAGDQNVFGSAVWDNNQQMVILKLVNTSSEPLKRTVKLDTRLKVAPNSSVILLSCPDPEGVNSIQQPERIAPVEQPFSMKGKLFEANLPPGSLAVFKIKMKH